MPIDLENGSVILVNKPLTWTSFDVTNKIKRMIIHKLHRDLGVVEGKKKKIKVGHAGTLDPLATGLLIVCIGKETKNIDSYMGMVKEYTGSIYLGASRPSFDKETEIDFQFEMNPLSLEEIQAAACKFEGEQFQIPPQYSAIKVNGQRAYTSARKGEEMKMEPRRIFIEKFEITKTNWPIVEFKVICSKGTYIRSLANDLGKLLGGGGYLDSLCRTAIGNFRIENAMSLEEIQAELAD
jgi:tRNA pseudouridine55 synthase